MTTLSTIITNPPEGIVSFDEFRAVRSRVKTRIKQLSRTWRTTRMDAAHRVLRDPDELDLMRKWILTDNEMERFDTDDISNMVKYVVGV